MSEDHDARHAISQLQRVVGEAAERERKRTEKEQLETVINIQKDVLSHAFDKAQVYHRIVVAGGYAAYFAAWAFTKDILEPSAMIAAAAFMAVSVVIFVFYQIYHMIRTTKTQMRQAQLLIDQPQNAVALLNQLRQTEKDDVIRTRRSWYLSLWGTLVPAVIAIILLVGNFIVYLAQQL